MTRASHKPNLILGQRHQICYHWSKVRVSRKGSWIFDYNLAKWKYGSYATISGTQNVPDKNEKYSNRSRCCMDHGHSPIRERRQNQHNPDFLTTSQNWKGQTLEILAQVTSTNLETFLGKIHIGENTALIVNVEGRRPRCFKCEKKNTWGSIVNSQKKTTEREKNPEEERNQEAMPPAIEAVIQRTHCQYRKKKEKN